MTSGMRVAQPRVHCRRNKRIHGQIFIVIAAQNNNFAPRSCSRVGTGTRESELSACDNKLENAQAVQQLHRGERTAFYRAPEEGLVASQKSDS